LTFNKKQKWPVVRIFAFLLVRFISKGFGVSVFFVLVADQRQLCRQLANFGGWFRLIKKQKASKRMGLLAN
jgi:hypothetical protein